MTKKDVLQAIIEKGKSKLKTARIDFEHKQFDDAISRAYYAVFHAISAVLTWNDMAFSSHSQTIGAFNKEFINTDFFPREFSEIIYDLFEARQTGDYDTNSWIDHETAENSLKNAELILNTIIAFLENKGVL